MPTWHNISWTAFIISVLHISKNNEVHFTQTKLLTSSYVRLNKSKKNCNNLMLVSCNARTALWQNSGGKGLLSNSHHFCDLDTQVGLTTSIQFSDVWEQMIVQYTEMATFKIHSNTRLLLSHRASWNLIMSDLVGQYLLTVVRGKLPVEHSAQMIFHCKTFSKVPLKSEVSVLCEKSSVL